MNHEKRKDDTKLSVYLDWELGGQQWLVERGTREDGSGMREDERNLW